MNKNYYEILGVEKTATQKEIKSAFRSLAKKHHPDISKEPDADVKFKEIQKAYDTLSDEAKRSHYDMYGETATTGYNQTYDYTQGDSFNNEDYYNYYNGFNKMDVQFVKFSGLSWPMKILLIILGLFLFVFIIFIGVIAVVIMLIRKIIELIIRLIGGGNG